jgi:hypothetical protein
VESYVMLKTKHALETLARENHARKPRNSKLFYSCVSHPNKMKNLISSKFDPIYCIKDEMNIITSDLDFNVLFKYSFPLSIQFLQRQKQ